MILDNEDQRKILLQIIEVAPVEGPVKAVRQILAEIDKLIEDVAAAPVASSSPPPSDDPPPLSLVP